jgi:hypothetical protein
MSRTLYIDLMLRPSIARICSSSGNVVPELLGNAAILDFLGGEFATALTMQRAIAAAKELMLPVDFSVLIERCLIGGLVPRLPAISVRG